MRYENEKAPVGAGTPARAAGKGLETWYPANDYNTILRKTPSISDLLHSGTTLRELVAMTGMNERLVRLKIQQERKAGKLILSNNRDGYFLPECPEDVRRFARSMSRRAAEIAGVARAAEAALAALLTQPTQAQAAQKAGIGLTTLKRYLDEPEFQTAYQEAVTKLLEEASVQAKQGLSPALSCLREIVEDRKTAATARIQAARSLLEYGLRLTETVDVMKQLNELEQWRDKVDGND